MRNWSDSEIEAGWNDQEGQGNAAARKRGNFCVMMMTANKTKALVISRLFLSEFAMPSCLHWDGKCLSMDCSQAGSGATSLRRSMEMAGKALVAAEYIEQVRIHASTWDELFHGAKQ